MSRCSCPSPSVSTACSPTAYSCGFPGPPRCASARLLRTLTVAAVALLARDDPRLAVDLGGVRLPGPVILSSMYYDVRILRRAMALGFVAY